MPSLGKRALRPPTRPGAWAAPAAFAAAAADFPRGMRTVRRVRGTGRIQRLLDGHAACCFFSLSCDSLGANSVLGASGAVVVCVCAARKMLRSELRDQTCPVCRLHRLIFSHIITLARVFPYRRLHVGCGCACNGRNVCRSADEPKDVIRFIF